MTRRWRRVAFGIATLLGPRPLGFFIPYRYAARVKPTGYPALEPIFAAAEPRMRDVLDWVEAVGPGLGAVADGPGPARFDQDWFPRLDAAAAYAVVRHLRPARIVEIGSGHSTRFLARAIADAGLATALVAIDPAPRAPLDGLMVRHEPALLADADPALFDALRAGDVLFVDSSHVAMPGSDVDLVVNSILPRLPAGVLLHVHDIVLPDAYPEDWAWRGYNEQSLVGALIQGGWEIVFSSHWVATRRPDWIAGGILARLPLRPGARETSLWLRRR